MKNIKLRVFAFLVLSCIAFAPVSFAQTAGKSPQDCDKLGPSTWKGGSLEEMRQQEAAYWGCRMAVPSETIKQWQQASDELDPITAIKIRTVNKQELVFVERMGGTMRCFRFSALEKTTKGWEKVWGDSGDEYCMIKCPGIVMRIFSSRLVLDTPKSSDPDCKQMFHKKEFIWDGKTFRPAPERAQDGKS